MVLESANPLYSVTKREYIAILALQAMLSNGNYSRSADTVFDDARVLAMKAATYANELLKEFENSVYG